MASTAAEVTGRADLEALDRAHPASRSIVPKWEELAGWRMHAIGAYSDGCLVAAMDVAVRRIAKLPVTLSRVTRLMLAEGREVETLEILLAELERFSLLHRSIETELRLRIPAGPGICGFEYGPALDRLLVARGYRPLDKIDSTYFVHIDRDDAELLASFDGRARNKIRRAEKDGAHVAPSDDESLLAEFYDAYLDMSERKRAPLPPRAFIHDGMIPLLRAKKALMMIERYEGAPSNMAVVDLLGTPCYALGARTRANVAKAVPGAAQILHFEIMKTLRAQGRRYYDLGGCEGPIPIEGHPNYGVWRFKHGFGGTFVRFLPYYRKSRLALLRPLMDAVHLLRGDYM